MNASTTPESTALATLPSAEVVESTTMGTASLILNGDAMERIFRFAEMMAKSVVSVPKHLQGKPADCLAISMQAAQWGMNPFAVAQKTHVVNGTLGYEAQLVNAVLQATGAIRGEFLYEYRGEGEAMECRVGAVPSGGAEFRWGEWLAMKLVTTRNSPLWKTNPRQQMGYLQVKNWARAFKPAAILGVYTTDELQDLPAPRNMGTAETVGPPEALLTSARAAAAQGVAAYQEFWTKAGPEGRKALASEHPALKQQAAEVDAARTVDQTAGAQAGAPTGEITLASVLDRMNAAKTEDALNVAMDWANGLADASERAEAEARYDVRLQELRA